MITLKQCRIKNWDGTRISPLDQIRDRITTKMQYLEIVQNALEKKSINKRFHDEPQRTVNELIRWCHGAMGMYPSTSTGCFYFESDLKKTDRVVEHTVPVSDLVKFYFDHKIDLGILLFFPVTLISKKSDTLLKFSAKSNLNVQFPFRRYLDAGFDGKIFTHSGFEIDLENYDISSHFDLILETANPGSIHSNKDFIEIAEHYEIKNKFKAIVNLVKDLGS